MTSKTSAQHMAQRLDFSTTQSISHSETQGRHSVLPGTTYLNTTPLPHPRWHPLNITFSIEQRINALVTSVLPWCRYRRGAQACGHGNNGMMVSGSAHVAEDWWSRSVHLFLVSEIFLPLTYDQPHPSRMTLLTGMSFTSAWPSLCWSDFWMLYLGAANFPCTPYTLYSAVGTHCNFNKEFRPVVIVFIDSPNKNHYPIIIMSK